MCSTGYSDNKIISASETQTLNYCINDFSLCDNCFSVLIWLFFFCSRGIICTKTIPKSYSMHVAFLWRSLKWDNRRNKCVSSDVQSVNSEVHRTPGFCSGFHSATCLPPTLTPAVIRRKPNEWEAVYFQLLSKRC